ncbi:TetR/AcrR family transcriptional regulator [Gandjariella thermophila]|uniref:TetR family transcriptional regulator n=1 Tax=Gandjariella thermophila TaxID=1931992 RepID=A0A4D4J163_9PSEU|nr:TetR family transcriptional regulator [Gandjariella thermophila]GDY28389.1 TetR family transcriptional regulator [Gandjariella thermophila]
MAGTRSPAPGLRERKKQQTRQALSRAAVRLAVERGLGNVLVEDIAAEAGVSPRTFNNYFGSKAEAICARHLDRARQVVAALRARPAGEPLWEAVTQAVLAQFGGEERAPDPEWTAGVRLMTGEPALQGEMLRADAIAERELAAVIAKRTGTDADRDLYPVLVSAAAGAATRAATHRWLRADPPVPMGPLLREALGLLAAGLPAPSTT